MPDKDIFFTREQEAKRLNNELFEIKEILREITRKISSIESRARRAYPSVFPKKKIPKEAKTQKISADVAALNKEQLFHLFDEVVQRTKDGDWENAKKMFDDISYPDLNLLRIELGVTLKSNKPSRAIVMKAINGRVQESVLLTKHTMRPK